MIKRLVYILPFLICGLSFSQEEGVDHHIEYGALLGASNYTGDLSPVPVITQFGPSAGLFYRHHLRDKISVIRANLQFGSISAKENNINDPLLKQRNLSFNRNFIEVAAIYEYKFFDFRDIKGTYFMTPYLFGGFGATMILDHTNALVIPFGVGVNFAVGGKLNLGFEFGARKTYSDLIDGYNDDVSLNSSHKNDWYYFTGITISKTVYNQICPEK